LRDASWTTDALLRLGYADEAEAFFWWLMQASRLTHPELHVLYRCDGSIHTREHEVDLAGYRGSKPVRVGNGAATQIQLDTYGDVLECARLFAEGTGKLDRATGKDIAAIADHVTKIWRQADSSIWEVRRSETHFTQSKAFCWVALDRASRLAEQGVIPDHRERWRPAADAIRRFIDENCWDAEKRSYVRATDMRELDASLLTMAMMAYDDPRGERMNGTIDAVQRELKEGPLVYRYRGEDGVQGDEGAFVTCSFWLVDSLAGAGRVDEAQSLMEELLGLANDVGLYSEEIDPKTGEFLGNFPQGLTHLALANAAVSIQDVVSGEQPS
jgi:GH15 family glucan-1,4-alpha-glucosidase